MPVSWTSAPTTVTARENSPLDRTKPATRSGAVQRGSAGHVDSKKGPGVFFRLGDLRPGDTVRISRKDRTQAIFEVDSLESVQKDRFPSRKVYGMVKFPGLRLITCGGAFDTASGHYRDNVIVYAHLVAGPRPVDRPWGTTASS